MRTLYVVAAVVAVLALCGTVCCGVASARPALHAGGPDSFRNAVEERVMNLPEDGDLWHFMIIGSPQDVQALDRAIAASPRLASLKRQTKHHRIATGSWWQRYYMASEAFPVVLLQTAGGELIYKASANNMPSDSESLADEIELGIEKHRSDCGPDGCKPSPSRPKPRVPDLRPDRDSSSGSGMKILLPVILIGGALVAAYLYQRSGAPQ